MLEKNVNGKVFSALQAMLSVVYLECLCLLL